MQQIGIDRKGYKNKQEKLINTEKKKRLNQEDKEERRNEEIGLMFIRQR